MDKYVYILRRLDYDGIIDKEYAIAGLENAKAFTRKTLFEDDTYVVTHCSFSDDYRKRELKKAHDKYDNMPIKLSKADWTWTYLEGGSYSGTWELKRLTLVNDVTVDDIK
jgi:hypothetical protein